MSRSNLILTAVLVLLLDGCGQYTPEPDAAKQTVAPPEVHAFLGKPADKPINFDLVGTWNVFRYDTPEKTSKLGRWETLWQLRKCPNGIWEDEHTLTRIYLSEGVPQTLMWNSLHGKRWFSINKWSFGLIEQMTGNDGELYMAIRTEGGETP